MLLKTKLKNQLSKYGNYEFELSNIVDNGVKKGCSGFIRNIDNGKIAYVNTEPCAMCNYEIIYRKAKDFSDFRGERNRWCREDELVSKLIKFLDHLES